MTGTARGSAAKGAGKRGAPLASQWWSQRFTTVLESYGLPIG
jgi:hypothetical protein